MTPEEVLERISLVAASDGDSVLGDWCATWLAERCDQE